jgi:hypothetical protein
MLTYADACERMLTFADTFDGHAAAGAAAAAGEATGMTYANELLTYANVC